MIGFSFGAGRAAKKATSAFDPATLVLSGWWRASYAGSPWAAVASAGASGSNGTLSEATNPPATGSAVNGLTPADFDGTNDRINSSASDSTLFEPNAWTVILLFWADTAASDAAVHVLPAIWSDTTGSVVGPIVAYGTAGVRAGHYDGGWKEVAVAAATGGWRMAFVRYGGTNIELGIDAGSLSSVAAGNISGIHGQPCRVGASYNATAFFDGKVLEVMVADVALDDTARSNVRSYFNARYGLSL